VPILRFLLILDNWLYKLIGLLAVMVNNGKHPKHHLIRYQEWFLDQIQAGWVVLDIGSNKGTMANLLSKKASLVYGIEMDPILYKIAKESYKAPNLEFIYGDVTTYDFSDCEPLDCVTLSNVLEHIPDRISCLRKLLHHLPWRTPDHPIFLIRVPTIERDWLTAYKREIGLEYRLDLSHKIEYTRSEFMQELDTAGLVAITFIVRYGEYYSVVSKKKQ